MTYIIPVIRQTKRPTPPKALQSRCFKITIVALIMLLLVAIGVLFLWVLYLNRTEDFNRDVPGTNDADHLMNYSRHVEYKVQQWRIELNASDFDLGGENGSPSYTTISVLERGYIIQELVKEMIKMKNTSFNELEESNDMNKMKFDAVLGDLCDPRVTCSREVTSSPYRTFDGSCNNLANPHWGTINRQQQRVIPSVYEDDIGTPRQFSASGERLPSPRAISNVVHRPRTDRQPDNTSTVMVMAFGQFFSHDLSLTPMMQVPDAIKIECCAMNYTNPMTGPFDACLPVDIPAGDSYFHDNACMTFVRSAPAVCDDCSLCRREPLNKMTSYIDASQVYGSTLELSNKLRHFSNGTMVVKGESQLLPHDKDKSCTLTVKEQHCFLAGDTRVNVVPNLSSFHIMFVRYHNHIALDLSEINPSWNDEKVFQEARKIVIAVMQKVVFDEYLPAVLGEYTMEMFGLYTQQRGHHLVYDNTIDATVSNSFSTAGFRFGHTTIPNHQMALTENYKAESTMAIEDTYKNPNMTYLFVDGISRWMTNARGVPADGNFGDGVRNLLFKTKTASTDLVARNIQRGRDHGLPSYNKWRQFFKMPVITETEFGQQGTKMGQFSIETSDNFRKIYSHPDDIDLFSGAIKEEALLGAQVGPVFAAILGTEFRKLKHGDRFYFENPSPINGPNTGFTTNQLSAIRKIRLSKVACESMHSPTIQRDVFRPPGDGNPMYNCNNLDGVELSHWRDQSV